MWLKLFETLKPQLRFPQIALFFILQYCTAAAPSPGPAPANALTAVHCSEGDSGGLVCPILFNIFTYVCSIISDS